MHAGLFTGRVFSHGPRQGHGMASSLSCFAWPRQPVIEGLCMCLLLLISGHVRTQVAVSNLVMLGYISCACRSGVLAGI